jgi:hypothetical protein
MPIGAGSAEDASPEPEDALWQKRLQRAPYEVGRAERQCQAVEPENRLVARSLERAWEKKLQAE